MATVYAWLNNSRLGSGILNSIPIVAASPLTSSGTAQLMDIVAEKQSYRYPSVIRCWVVLAMGGNVWVKFGGANVVAAVGSTHYCKQGELQTFCVSNDAALEYISVIDAV